MTTPLNEIKHLADLTGLRQSDLIVLHPQHDPFAVGTPTDVKLARWYADAVATLPAGARHQRKVHYDLLDADVQTPSGHLYGANPDADYRLLVNASKAARVLGLADPFENIDRRTNTVIEADELRAESDPEAEVSGPDLWVPHLSPVFDYPEVSLLLPDRRRLQPITVEIVAEKSSVLDPDLPDGAAIHAVAARLGLRVSETTGYAPRGLGEAIVRRTMADGRPRVVLWLSDADSSGESMAPGAARYVEFLSTVTDCPRILLDRVALTLDQVAEIEQEIGREIPLAPDVRREEGRVELEAILSRAPGWIGREVRRRVEEVYDEIPDYDDAVEAAQADIEDAWKDHAADEIEAAEEIERRLRGYLAGNEAVEASRLKEFAKLAQDAAADLDAARDSFDLEIEFDPEVEVDLDYDQDDRPRDWLLDTERDYITQLNAYSRHAPAHKRRPPVVIEERLCEWCGDPITGRRSGVTKFCSESHAQRARNQRRKERRS